MIAKSRAFSVEVRHFALSQRIFWLLPLGPTPPRDEIHISGASRPRSARILWLQGARFRKRLARHHLRSGCGIENDARHDRRSLHQVSRLCVIIDIHIRVMRARAIFQAILDELESGYSQCIK